MSRVLKGSIINCHVNLGLFFKIVKDVKIFASSSAASLNLEDVSTLYQTVSLNHIIV